MFTIFARPRSISTISFYFSQEYLIENFPWKMTHGGFKQQNVNVSCHFAESEKENLENVARCVLHVLCFHYWDCDFYFNFYYFICSRITKA